MRENKELQKKTQLKRITKVYNELYQYSKLIDDFCSRQRGNESSRNYAFNHLRA